jgi:hypothetical protein
MALSSFIDLDIVIFWNNSECFLPSKNFSYSHEIQYILIAFHRYISFTIDDFHEKRTKTPDNFLVTVGDGP